LDPGLHVSLTKRTDIYVIAPTLHTKKTTGSFWVLSHNKYLAIYRHPYSL